MKNLKLKSLAVLLIAAVGFTSCSDDESPREQEGNAKMSVKLVDAPGDYEEVNIEVVDVMIKYNNDTEVSLDVDDEIYNLLELTGGVSAALATEYEIPAGDINQIRLVLGSNNTVVVDGTTHDLQTPSAQQSGLKINLNETLQADVVYEYTLDFDVEESIVEQGNGGYLLKPVIRASAEAQTGTVSGTVLPATDAVLVSATDGTTTVDAYTNAQGEFVLHGLPEGTYTVTFTPDATLGLNVVTVNDIDVTAGEVSAMGEIDLNTTTP
ncbi:DUF4382 domain-containing protein [Mesonia sp. K7]|uniref:DUF4382 domain-containing protein n=1 Tax=Mesonia sp. K7 TaxID=2218606 RepID=UPI000DAA1261|nr:DUF4382 domain-containing protein [Mesonia sp. K7]PZD79038.1 carbohydrate-binding protein [Mesonia sp. K7]